MKLDRVNEELIKTIETRREFLEASKTKDVIGMTEASWKLQIQLLELLVEVCEDEEFVPFLQNQVDLIALKIDSTITMVKGTI